jgi:F0F1-type ATP synthase assembly protein I
VRTNVALFLVAGLLVAAGLALLASPFADSSPDGLEKVAEDKGFRDTAKEHDLAESPVADYDVAPIGDERLSTGVAGLIGVLVTFGLGLAVFALVRALRPRGSGATRRGDEPSADPPAAVSHR